MVWLLVVDVVVGVDVDALPAVPVRHQA